MTSKELGRAIRESRISKDMTKEDLAIKSGVSKGSISKIEKGECNPLITTIWKIADGLGMNCSDLYEYAERIK